MNLLGREERVSQIHTIWVTGSALVLKHMVFTCKLG